MFARKVAVRLKPDSLRPFIHLMEHEIVPWLRRQEGFLDLIVLVAPDNTEVASLSFWDDEGNAQAFNSSGYPQVLDVLGKLFDGVPYVKTFEVASSTLHGLVPASDDPVLGWPNPSSVANQGNLPDRV